jgi:hypothetical protein
MLVNVVPCMPEQTLLHYKCTGFVQKGIDDGLLTHHECHLRVFIVSTPKETEAV